VWGQSGFISSFFIRPRGKIPLCFVDTPRFPAIFARLVFLMLTWIQTSFGKHHRVLLGALLGITIVSFVFFGAWSGAQGARRAKTFLGVDLNSQKQMESYLDFAFFDSVIGTGLAQGDSKTAILLKHLADTAQIPDPTPEQAKKFFETLSKSAPNLQGGLAAVVEAASNRLGIRPEAAALRFERFLFTLWRVQAVKTILAGPGFAVPYGSALQWRAETTRWTVETATLPAASFSPQIPAPEDTLKTYFAENKENFRLPPVVHASYALFSPSPEDIAAVTETPTDEQLKAYVFNNFQNIKIPGFDLFKLDEQLKTHRAELEKSWRAAQARDRLAGRISTLMALQLPVSDEPANPDHISSVLSANGSAETPLPAFDKDSIPQNLPVPGTLLGNVLKLTSEIWRSDVYPLPDKVVVFFHKKTDPSRLPEFAEVREKVTAAYLAQEKKRLFAEHSARIGKQLREAAAAGKNFAQTARDLGLSTEEIPPFTFPESPEKFNTTSLLPELNRLAEGEITPVLKNGEDTFYARLVKKDAPPFDLNAPEVQTRTAQNALTFAQLTLEGYTPPNNSGETFGGRVSGLLLELRLLAEPVPELGDAENADS
jgi:peptidyl-prolyl cis-trans isomerase D